MPRRPGDVRIAFYAPMKSPTDPTPSGDGRMARLLMAALERGGAAVELASTFRAYDRGDRHRQARLEALGIRLAARLVHRFRARPPTERPAVWFTYHLYHKAPDHLGPLVSAALDIPYAVAEASHAPKQARGPWALGFEAAERGIGAADRIYGFNPVDAACLHPIIKDASVLVDLPPFIDIAPFAAASGNRPSARPALCAQFGFNPNVPLLLTVAMMRADQKLRSYAVLADALERLRFDPWTLLVVGSGPADAAVRALFVRLGDRVRFAGRREGEGLLDCYASADIFAWPAVKEAFGVAFIEAAAAGLAIVAGRSGGISRIVEDGVTGLVVPAGDAEAMAGALRRLLRDRHLVTRLAGAGAERARRINDIASAGRFLTSDLGSLLSRRNIRVAG